MSDYSKAQNLVDKFILQNQTVVIEELFRSEFLSLDDIENYPLENEILEWWLVDRWIGDKLHSHQEAIILSNFGCWWGRTCSGQDICMDSVINDIAQSFEIIE